MCLESLFGGAKEPVQKAPELPPLPTKDDEDVKAAKRDTLLAAKRRKGFTGNIKNFGGALGITGDADEAKHMTLSS